MQWSRLLPILPFWENEGGNKILQPEPSSSSLPLLLGPDCQALGCQTKTQFPSLSHRIFTDLASVPERIWALHKLPYFYGAYRGDFQTGSQLPLLIFYLSRNWDLLLSLLPTVLYKKQLAMDIYDKICRYYHQATLGKDPKGPSVKAKVWCLSYREKETVKLPSSHVSKVEGRWLCCSEIGWSRVVAEQLWMAWLLPLFWPSK